MEAMHKDSCACAKSELDLFSVPPTQVEMEKGFWEDIDPITSIAASDTIEFLCAANSGVYTDLASSYLHVKAKITAADGTNLDADVQVGPVNLWLHALFSQVEVFLNNKLVTPSSTAYPYRAYIETILNFSKDAKDSHLTSALFYKDKAGKMDSVNPLAEAANVLTVIDVLSKYAWVEPIKTKTGENLVKAFEKILRKGRKPETFHSDKGTEFTNRLFQKYLKKNNIRFFTTQNAETKASIIERFNRTLKTKMWKYFTANNTLKYIDILQKLVKSYNHSRHRSIGMRPVDVNEANKGTVWQNLYGNESTRSTKYKFNIGDQVRISKTRRTFKKGYLPNWTEEVFTITERIPRQPPVYRIADYDGEKLDGTFYEQELEKAHKSETDYYRVEKVLRTRMRNNWIKRTHC